MVSILRPVELKEQFSVSQFVHLLIHQTKLCVIPLMKMLKVE